VRWIRFCGTTRIWLSKGIFEGKGGAAHTWFEVISAQNREDKSRVLSWKGKWGASFHIQKRIGRGAGSRKGSLAVREKGGKKAYGRLKLSERKEHTALRDF